MNANKRNYGWILCPSKTFAGKFYYFNVVTGEAAWSLNDVEKKTMMAKNNYIEKVNDKWHGYPEPDSPPMDESPTTMGQNWQYKKPDYPQYNRQFTNQPIFGQAVFPKYASHEPYLPNGVWGPMQVHQPMQIPQSIQVSQPMQFPQPMFVSPEMRKPFDQFWEPERELFFQYPDKGPSRRMQDLFDGNKFCDTSTPMTNKWGSICQNNNSTKHVFGPSQSTSRVFEQPFNKQVFRQNQNLYDSLFKPQTVSDVSHKPKAVIREPIFHQIRTQRTQSESQIRKTNEIRARYIDNFRAINDSACSVTPECSPENNCQPVLIASKSFSPKLVKSFGNLTVKDKILHRKYLCPKKAETGNFKSAKFTTSKSSENLEDVDDSAFCDSRSLRKRVKSASEVDEQTEKSDDLDKTDLRYTLLAKRRKSVDLGEVHMKTFDVSEGKKIKTRYDKNGVKTVTPKKCVTFDFDLETEETSIVEENEEPPVLNTVEDLSIKGLRNLAEVGWKTDHWYIVVDTDALLEDFEFIEGFVQSDDKCILLIPLEVRSQIESLTVGDCRGRQRVLVARQLSRRFAAPPAHIALQLTEEEQPAEPSLEDSIINCCFQVLEEEYHVVLLTNNEELCTKAKSMYLYCFKLQDIKDEAALEKPEVSFKLHKLPKFTKNNETVTKNNEKVTKNNEKVIKNYRNDDNVAKNHDKVTKKSGNSVRVETVVFQVKNDYNPFAVNKKKIPINCFRKGLLNSENYENYNTRSLFSPKNYENITETETSNQNHRQNVKMSADCSKKAKNIFPPKNLTRPIQNVDHEIDTVSTSDIGREVQKLNLFINFKKDLRRDSGEVFVQNRNMKEQVFNEDSQMTFNPVTEQTKSDINLPKPIKLKNINGYTLDVYLKRFQVKNKTAEDRVKTRIDEWICSFTQTMEESLSNVLQSVSAPMANNLSPPWILPDAIECIRETYSDHATAKILVEKLASMLHDCSCNRGKLKSTTKPNDFLRILGCSILLIQCLKSIEPESPALTEAEASLNNLLQDMIDPPPDAKSAAMVATPKVDWIDVQGKRDERANFIKKPSEVTDYLKKHFRSWQSPDVEQDVHRTLKLLREPSMESKRKTKVVRTFGKDINLLKIDSNKSIIFNTTSISHIKNDIALDQNAEKAAPEISMKISNTESANKEAGFIDDVLKDVPRPLERETGAKLLKKLALNSGLKPKLKEIDLEKREKINIELTDMIENIVNGKPATLATGLNKSNDSVIPKTVTDSDSVLNASKHGMSFKQIDNELNVNRSFSLSPSFEQRGSFGSYMDTATEINEKDNFEPALTNAKNEANFEKTVFDLDTLDYSDFEACLDGDVTLKSFDDNQLNEPVNNDEPKEGTEVNNDNQKVEEMEAENDGDNLLQNNVNKDVQADTTNDSGFENGDVQTYAVAKTCLTELGGAFMDIYTFINNSIMQFPNNPVSENKKKKLHEKTNVARELVIEIIKNLNSIIQRESIGTPLKNLLVTHAEASKDVHVTRQVVTKCLEQAKMLERALKIMLTVTDLDCDAKVSDSGSSTIQYYNIFE